jgi:hypothetical protein
MYKPGWKTKLGTHPASLAFFLNSPITPPSSDLRGFGGLPASPPA